FDANGGTIDGSETKVVKVKEGSKITAPNAVRDGYTLTGWYATKQASSKWNFETGVVTENITLTAWWSGSSAADNCDHDYQPDQTRLDDWTEATCTKNGKQYYKCSKCLMPYTETIQSLGHQYVENVIEPTCAKEGYTEKYCTNPGCNREPSVYNKVSATGKHDYDLDGDGDDDYKYTILPTDYTPGKEMKTCKVCNGSQYFSVEPLSMGDKALFNLLIDNYLYKGETPFVNIAGFGGSAVTSFYTICVGSNINDGKLDTYWSADTLADGSTYTGDIATITFNEYFEIGAFNFIVPFYSSWELGDNCYVSYDIEALVKDGDGEKWVKVGEISDKDAKASGINGAIMLELNETVTAKAVRAKVTHSTRYSAAIIYEVEVFANVEKIQRVPDSLLSEATAKVSGKYNAYAKGAEALTDGDMNSAWYTDWRNANSSNAVLEFSGEKFVSSVQFAIHAKAGRTVSLSYWVTDESMGEGGYWEEVNQYAIPNKLNGNTDEMQIITADGSTACLYTIKLEKRTSKLKLQFVKEPEYWTSYVYCFEPYTVYERADGVEGYLECTHKSIRAKADGVVKPTCMDAGYTVYACQSCGYELRTDATSALGHSFGEFVPDAVTVSTNGFKTESAVCTRECGTTRTRNYTDNYEVAVITPYYKNAPAAWVQTYDDGNYISACEWSIEQFNRYHYRATMNMSISFADLYVSEWQEMFATGVFDLGSHSYNHAGIYSGQISEADMLSDVDRAHYWFMNNFHGQKILTFATPNGSTSTGTANYVTQLMASGRNGGAGGYINYISDLKTQTDWGNLNCYASKADQSEGDFVLIKDGSTGGTYKPVYETSTNDAGEEVNTLVGFEWSKSGSYTSKSFDSYVDGNSGEYILVHYIAAYGNFTGDNFGKDYKFIAKSDLNVNYVYSEEEKTLVNVGTVDGSYYYDAENYQMKWVEGGSYDFDPNTRTYTFKEDGSGAYKLNHTAKGSYEKIIDEILGKGAFTIECIHSLAPNTHYLGGMIHSSYVSTMSKYDYLKKQGLWVCSYTDMTQYLKESLSATLDTKEITSTSITLTLTDTQVDYMFDHALTIKVDIPDEWTNVSVMQGDRVIELVTYAEYTDNMTVANCTIKDGYLYVDAIPDRGDIVITLIAE
ncbi:MAG: InlB B-repeat-containing protein, partial [Clostridia bacterium]|nr:InlB B-repeat-containing protein [Clostridia bacterium]